MFLATALGTGAAKALGGGLVGKMLNPGAGKPKESPQQKAVNQASKAISKKMPGPISGALVNLGIQTFFASRGSSGAPMQPPMQQPM